MQAVQTTPQGITVTIEVSPKSDKFQIAGYNEWRKTLEVKLKSPPTKGKANKELLKEFSGLTGHDTEIVAGHKSRQKTILIYDMDENDFHKLLEDFIKF
jgi:TIGR00251 family protein